MENVTEEFMFVLNGLNETATKKHIYFGFVLTAYLFTVFVNSTLILTIFLEKVFHEPMYFFLCNLCINAILGANSFYPRFLFDLLSKVNQISYYECLIQVCFIFYYIFCEYTSLTVMAYDRFVAVCKPLEYHSVMTPQRVLYLLLFTWLFSLTEIIIGALLTGRLPMCGRHIAKIYCSNWPLVKLSCVDSIGNNIYGYVLMFIHVSEAILIIISYVFIIRTSLRSKSGWVKFMQTCLPHLITLINFNVALLFDVLDARFGSTQKLQAIRNFLAVELLIVPPLLNPLIYGITLTKIRNRIIKVCKHRIKAVG
ncbi:olfactory receptor 142-like [Alosa alosa]|uniref:olfactory receptor 142-like n=1 Tax=Alosa alosa TaxID=278164 RepID=UPI0020154710|nr:olfactory receptor 142-like [Alosa alosa]